MKGDKNWDKKVEGILQKHEEFVKKKMIDYAKQKCKEQRIICAKKARGRQWAQDPPQFTIDLSSIENAPEPNFD